MNIKEALLEAKSKNGCAVLGETVLTPFVGRMSTITGGGTYDDYSRTFAGIPCYGVTYVSWHELISEDWVVNSIEEVPKPNYGFGNFKQYVFANLQGLE